MSSSAARLTAWRRGAYETPPTETGFSLNSPLLFPLLTTSFSFFSFLFLHSPPPIPSLFGSLRSSAPSTSLGLLSWRRRRTLELSLPSLPRDWVARSPAATTEALIMQFWERLPCQCHSQGALILSLSTCFHCLTSGMPQIKPICPPTHVHLMDGLTTGIHKRLYDKTAISINNMAAIWESNMHEEAKLYSLNRRQKLALGPHDMNSNRLMGEKKGYFNVFYILAMYDTRRSGTTQLNLKAQRPS